MTATEELRRMLDERGVEWSGIGDHTVLWCRRDAKYANYDAQASDWGDKLMLSWACTPEQAIEATLGRGTCKWEPADFITEGEWWNTSCGESFTWEPDGTPNCCPNCGRRVVK